MEYVYRGPGPVQDPEGSELTRPGDIREFDAEPAWGPWEPVKDPEATEGGDPPGPPEASPAALSAAPALNPAPAPAATRKGM